jgi:hypothetical protein
MIDYVLEDNRLTKDKTDDRCARSVNVRSYTETDLADAISRRNLGISKAEALAMIEASNEIQLDWLTGGNAVNLRLAHYHFGIPGSFKEGEYPTEAVVRITPSKELSEAAKKIHLRHVEPTVQLKVDYVEDVKTATTNQFITIGGSVKIFGHNLKIAGTDTTVGVQFFSLEDLEVTYPIAPVNIIINNPSELLIIAPQMVVNEPIQLKITTQYSGNTVRNLKDPRSVVFEKIFTVKA